MLHISTENVNERLCYYFAYKYNNKALVNIHKGLVVNQSLIAVFSYLASTKS